MVFVMFAAVGQIDPILKIITNKLEIVFKRIFSYNEILPSLEERSWCVENIRNFWFEFNDVYYFSRERDAAAFKLAWI